MTRPTLGLDLVALDLDFGLDLADFFLGISLLLPLFKRCEFIY
jgi:hypothetical protein